MKTKIIVGSVALVILLLVIGFYISEKHAVARISTFEECAQNGFPIQESYPARCSTPDGRTFVQDIGGGVPTAPIPPDSDSDSNPATTTGSTDDLNDLISVTLPRSGATVTSPLNSVGQARGSWYFEASFPVELLDANDERIASGPAHAQGDWMTSDFVPFTISLNYTSTTTQSGMLVFHKDNPSGLPENEKELRVPVVISATK